MRVSVRDHLDTAVCTFGLEPERKAFGHPCVAEQHERADVRGQEHLRAHARACACVSSALWRASVDDTEKVRAPYGCKRGRA